MWWVTRGTGENKKGGGRRKKNIISDPQTIFFYSSELKRSVRGGKKSLQFIRHFHYVGKGEGIIQVLEGKFQLKNSLKCAGASHFPLSNLLRDIH